MYVCVRVCQLQKERRQWVAHVNDDDDDDDDCDCGYGVDDDGEYGGGGACA